MVNPRGVGLWLFLLLFLLVDGDPHGLLDFDHSKQWLCTASKPVSKVLRPLSSPPPGSTLSFSVTAYSTVIICTFCFSQHGGDILAFFIGVLSLLGIYLFALLLLFCWPPSQSKKFPLSWDKAKFQMLLSSFLVISVNSWLCALQKNEEYHASHDYTHANFKRVAYIILHLKERILGCFYSDFYCVHCSFNQIPIFVNTRLSGIFNSISWAASFLLITMSIFSKHSLLFVTCCIHFIQSPLPSNLVRLHFP